jgi:pimeloyl-ACP methyl ester carboxylesterase
MRNELAPTRAFISPIRGLNRLLLPEALLDSITTPTLLLWGENDPFGGADVARSVAARVPNAELRLLPGAGHAPWLDDLDTCAVATSQFLASHRP